MNEMIERVARAICWKNGWPPDTTLGGDGVTFLWHEYEGQARAAIEAMREPSDAMLEAVEASASGALFETAHGLRKMEGANSLMQGAVPLVWKAMIDSVLAPSAVAADSLPSYLEVHGILRDESPPTPPNKHIGSTLDDFLEEEGVLKEFEAEAIKKATRPTTSKHVRPR